MKKKSAKKNKMGFVKGRFETFDNVDRIDNLIYSSCKVGYQETLGEIFRFMNVKGVDMYA